MVAQLDTDPQIGAGDRETLSRSDIREIQQLLTQLGFRPGPIDGKFGPSTARAISAYQKANGLAVDGTLSLALLQRLRRDKTDQTEQPPSKPTEEAAFPDSPDSNPPDGSAPPPPQSSQSASLVGTTWLFTDVTGSDFSLRFARDGAIEGVLYEKFWKWRQDGKDIKVIYDNGLGLTVVREGTLTSMATMEGTALPSRGGVWTWTAERTQPPIVGSEDFDVKPDGQMKTGTDLETAGEDATPTDRGNPVPPDSDPQTETGSETVGPPPNSGAASLEESELPKPEQPLPDPDQLPSNGTTGMPERDAAPAIEEKEKPAGDAETVAREPRVYGSESDNSRIVIHATDDSWVEIADSAGNTMFSRVLRSGDSYRLPPGEGGTMVTGNAGGIEILVDGESVEFDGPDNVVRRGIKLDPEVLKAGRAPSQ